MSEPKPQRHDADKLEEVSLEIQRVAIQILNTATELSTLEQRMEDLQKQRDELRGGQKFFSLDEFDD